MKIFKYVFILAITFVFLSLITDEYNPINSIAFVQPASLTTDRLGNAYMLVENQLLQFGTDGKPKANFSGKNLGEIGAVDVTNPMKILLFYPDFAKIIQLDNKLAFQSEIELRQIQINQPLAVCNSEEDGYWVFDRQDDMLKKVDMSLQIIHQSGNMTQVIGYQIQPNMMLQTNGFIYVNNPETGILVFDRYGEYYKTFPYKNLLSFQVIGREILFTSGNKLLRVDTKTGDEKEVLLPVKNSIINARIEQHELYLLTNDSLRFYSF
jgi:hypothetical protein